MSSGPWLVVITFEQEPAEKYGGGEGGGGVTPPSRRRFYSWLTYFRMILMPK
jgi:hypothetical protein